MNSSLDAIALLKADHRRIEELFGQFESARRDHAAKTAIVRRICVELTVHSVIEEEIFYPACAGKLEDKDLIPEAYVEHDSAKVLIAQILDGDPADDFYDAKVKVLSEQVKHHIHQEEKNSEGLFAGARDAGLNVDALGEQLIARQQELLTEMKDMARPTAKTTTFSSDTGVIPKALDL